MSGAIGGDGLTKNPLVKKHMNVLNKNVVGYAKSFIKAIPNGASKNFASSFSYIGRNIAETQTTYMVGMGASYVVGRIFGNIDI